VRRQAGGRPVAVAAHQAAVEDEMAVIDHGRTIGRRSWRRIG